MLAVTFSVIFLHKLFSITGISAVSLLLLSILFFSADSIFRHLTTLVEYLFERKNEKEQKPFSRVAKNFYRYLNEKIDEKYLKKSKKNNHSCIFRSRMSHPTLKRTSSCSFYIFGMVTVKVEPVPR